MEKPLRIHSLLFLLCVLLLALGAKAEDIVARTHTQGQAQAHQRTHPMKDQALPPQEPQGLSPYPQPTQRSFPSLKFVQDVLHNLRFPLVNLQSPKVGDVKMDAPFEVFVIVVLGLLMKIYVVFVVSALVLGICSLLFIIWAIYYLIRGAPSGGGEASYKPLVQELD